MVKFTSLNLLPLVLVVFNPTAHADDNVFPPPPSRGALCNWMSMFCPGPDWYQIGSDLDGRAGGDWFGSSVAISGDGLTVAAGAYENDDKGTKAGMVQVKKYDGSDWKQVGELLYGEAYDRFGYALDLSENGDIIAVGGRTSYITNQGSATVMKFNGTHWNRMGPKLEGEIWGDYFGGAVALSADGLVLAVGAEGKNANGIMNSGQVYVYNYDQENDDWNLDFVAPGMIKGDGFGSTLALSGNGKVLAVGAKSHDSSGQESGIVCVFKKGEEMWTRMGVDILGTQPGEKYGTSIALSFEGDILAVGAEGVDSNGVSSGRARIFRMEGEHWFPIGQRINGDSFGDALGTSIDLSKDGTVVAIGITGDDARGVAAGKVLVLQYAAEDDRWHPFGDPLWGESFFDYAGGSVALSKAGTELAIGANHNDGVNGANSGHVRVFHFA